MKNTLQSQSFDAQGIEWHGLWTHLEKRPTFDPVACCFGAVELGHLSTCPPAQARTADTRAMSIVSRYTAEPFTPKLIISCKSSVVSGISRSDLCDAKGQASHHITPHLQNHSLFPSMHASCINITALIIASQHIWKFVFPVSKCVCGSSTVGTKSDRNVCHYTYSQPTNTSEGCNCVFENLFSETYQV